MRQLPALLLGLAWLLPAGTALAEDPPATPPDQRTSEELAGELDRVVREALEQGLLAPVGETGARVHPAPAQQSHPSDTDSHEPTPSAAEIYGCEGMIAPDFTTVAELARYQDIYALPIQGGPSPDPAEVKLLTKAYVALGMNPEALMVMQRSDDPSLAPYREIAILMESRARPNIQFFRELAACDPKAEFWLSIALIADNRPEGVAILRNHMADYRRLPLQLRANVATITASALSGLDEITLGRRLLADFTEEEIADSARLQFSLALLNMGEGRYDGEDIVRDFMLEPQYQQEALSAILRSDRPISGVEKDLVIEALMRQMALGEDEADLAASLGFTLRELSSGTYYEEIAELADLPGLQGEASQEAIRHHYVGALRRGLASESPLGNLAAIRALVSQKRLVDGQAEEAELFQQATDVAERLGRTALAARLSEISHDTNRAAQYRAELAFRHGEDAAVIALAQAHSNLPDITLLGARSAVRMGDARLLTGFVSRMELTRETVLTLIEDDAESGNWVVPDRVYGVAQGLSDGDSVTRATRVLAARIAARRAVVGPEPLTIADVPDVLQRTRQALAALAGEIN